jgi:hypothetical protein
MKGLVSGVNMLDEEDRLLYEKQIERGTTASLNPLVQRKSESYSALFKGLGRV